MSHLIEEYSQASGLQIDFPTIYEDYFPLPFEKYVLIHASSGMPAKNYDYFSEVVSMIRPTLVENGYELLQIGGKDDQSIINAIDLRGKTSLAQTAYLIHRAALIIGNDSCNLHFASTYDTPSIGLYGPTSPLISGPFFGNKSKQICLESDRNGNKPTFNSNENPKTINMIKPETISQTVFDLLKIDKKTNIETVFIGSQYNQSIVEIIMDTVIKSDFFPGSILNARLDYLFDEEVLIKNLSLRPLCILTDKPININILKQFRQHIPMVIYTIDENFSLRFIKEMLEAGIPYQITTFLEGEKLNQAKLALFDYGVIISRSKNNKEKLEFRDKLTKDSKYKTNKFLLSNNQIFLNKTDWLNKNSIKDFQDNTKIISIDNLDFFQELDWMYIFNETI